MFGIFRKQARVNNYITDVHSHLVPGVDDGVQSFEEALEILVAFNKLGTKKVTTTPHIMSDLYPNRETDLIKIGNTLKEKIVEKGVDIELSIAAEYFLDESLMDKIEKTPDTLLTFGGEFLLFETSFYNRPLYINDFIFKAKSAGLKPVLAHPERYSYLYNDFSAIEDLVERGVLLQLNIISLAGFYSKQIKKFAEQLVEKKLVHFIGSDCHNTIQCDAIKTAMRNKYYTMATKLPLLNYEL